MRQKDREGKGKAEKGKNAAGKTVSKPEKINNTSKVAGAAAGTIAGAMAGPAAGLMAKAATAEATKQTPAKAKPAAPKRTEKKAGKEQTEKKKTAEATAKIISKTLGALPIVSIAATTPGFEEAVGKMLMSMEDGLTTEAKNNREFLKEQLEKLKEKDRSAYEIFIDSLIIIGATNRSEALSEAILAKENFERIKGFTKNTVETITSPYTLTKKMIEILSNPGKIEEIVSDPETLGELLMVVPKAIYEEQYKVTHPYETTSEWIKENGEELIKSTPEEQGVLISEVLLNILPEPRIKGFKGVTNVLKKVIKEIKEIEKKIPETKPNIKNNPKTEEEKNEEKEEEVTYPPRTEEARKQAQIVAEAMEGLVKPTKCKSVTVFTHADGSVSVGLSGNSDLTYIYGAAERLQKRLGDGYSVSAHSIPLERIETIDGGNIKGFCSEPKAAMAANSNPSPITGMDTVWRGEGNNRHKYTGNNIGEALEGKYEQMRPCNTCADQNNIKEYMKYANGYSEE